MMVKIHWAVHLWLVHKFLVKNSKETNKNYPDIILTSSIGKNIKTKVINTGWEAMT